MGGQGTVVIVKEPLRGLVDGGDAAALEAYLAAHPATDMRQPYDDFRTPSLAHRLIDLGHDASLRVALERGGAPVARIAGLHGATLAHVAARRGSVEALRSILALNPAAMDATDSLGWAPLHDAAMEGRLPVAAYLVRRGANAALPTSDGQLPASLARTADAAGASGVADLLDAVYAAGGLGPWLGGFRYPFALLRALAARRRAAPCLVLAPDAVALATFLFPESAENDDARRRPCLPESLLPVVLRYVF